MNFDLPLTVPSLDRSEISLSVIFDRFSVSSVCVDPKRIVKVLFTSQISGTVELLVNTFLEYFKNQLLNV